MANMNRLRGRAVEAGKNMEELSALLGISRSTLYRKLADDGETFTIKEADQIIRALNLTGEDAYSIFFTPVSHNAGQNA